ncbi:MAG: TetR/AcrR family transcriptional regulator [bacterium]|nr:TetR/AcrR family transcriptional regulator [bacterium]
MTKPKRRKEARPQEIIAAALATFAESGFAGAKMEAIATRAGAAKGTIYRYFDTKDALFEAVVRETISPIFATVDDLVGAWQGSKKELLAMFVRKVYQELVNRPDRRVIMKILISEGARFPRMTQFYHEEILVHVKQRLRRLLQLGVDSGEFRNALVLNQPDVVVGPAILAAVWKIAFDEIDPLDIDAYANAHIDLLMNGLLADSP